MELAKKSPFEDAGGAKGSQTELQLSARGAQRRAKGAKREPEGAPTGATFALFFCYIYWLRFGIVLLMVLEWFWDLFWSKSIQAWQTGHIQKHHFLSS